MKQIVLAGVPGSVQNGAALMSIVLNGIAKEVGRDGVIATAAGLAFEDTSKFKDFFFTYQPIMGEYLGALDKLTAYSSQNMLSSGHMKGLTLNGIGYWNGVDVIIGNHNVVESQKIRAMLASIRNTLLEIVGPQQKGFYLPLLPAGAKNSNMVRFGKLHGEMNPVMVGDHGPATAMGIDMKSGYILFGVTNAKKTYIAATMDERALGNGSADIVGTFENAKLTHIAAPYDNTVRIGMRSFEDNKMKLGKFDLNPLMKGANEIKPLGPMESLPDNMSFAGTAKSGHASIINLTTNSLHYVPAKPEGTEILPWLQNTAL